MSKILVAYFSAMGATKKVAESLAYVKGADIYEIVPKTPYTMADLDWTNKNSRTTIEMKDKSSRPAIADKPIDVSGYDVVYLGFPIWWYIAPTIINTFLEKYDFTGKTIIPFATSGSSGMGETNKYLAPSCKGAVLKEGVRVRADVSPAELAKL